MFTEPQQGATYDDLLAVARTAEQFGYGAFFRSDHYLGMGTRGEPGPTDAWVTLAGLARDTSTIRLGTLMTSVTFRHPGVLAISVAGVDQMSGGRVELGLGAGWYEAEHAAYGILSAPASASNGSRRRWRSSPGCGTRRRAALRLRGPALPAHRLAGAAQAGAVAAPAGAGRRQGPAAHPGPAARFADEFNIPFESVGFTTKQFGRVRDACAEAGRDPGSLVYSNALVLCCGRDEAEVRRRADAIGRDVDELRAHGLAGTPAEVVDRLGHYADAGAGRAYLQMLDLQDLDHLELVAAEVMPQARGL